MKSYRTEYEARLLSLTNTVLHPDVVIPLVDAVLAQANPAEAAPGPRRRRVQLLGRRSSFRSFAIQRHDFVNTQLAAVRADAGPDQTVIAGNIVQFDARASRPDPAPNVVYTWSNGLAGDFPAARFDVVGVYRVTLTISVDGIPYEDDVVVTVIPAPTTACQEVGGQVVVEAEHFYAIDDHGAAGVDWVADSSRAGYSGASALLASPTGGRVTFPSGLREHCTGGEIRAPHHESGRLPRVDPRVLIEPGRGFGSRGHRRRGEGGGLRTALHRGRQAPTRGRASRGMAIRRISR
jgi:hypothetical protein